MNPEKDRINAKKSVSWIRIFFNKYLIVSVLFVVWMMFFDQNSFLIHKELDKELRELKVDKKLYEEKLKNEEDLIFMMKNNPDAIEKVAREKHYLKKENEDVFIIEEKRIKKKEFEEEVEVLPLQ